METLFLNYMNSVHLSKWHYLLIFYIYLISLCFFLLFIFNILFFTDMLFANVVNIPFCCIGKSCLFLFFLGNRSFFRWEFRYELHQPQYLSLSFQDVARRVCGVKAYGVGQCCGNQCALAGREFGGSGMELVTGGCLCPVDAFAHFNGVEVDRHYPFFRPEEFYHPCEVDFESLAEP